MFTIVFLIVFSGFNNGTVWGYPEGRIVGGSLVSIEKYPYQVSLGLAGFLRCGAVILTSKVAVTAAHCVIDVSQEAITLRSGSTQCEKGGQVHRISRINIHPKFKVENFAYDLALMEIADQFMFDRTTAPIPLAEKEAEEGVLATAVGWGRINCQGEMASSLRAVSVPIISRDECKSIYPDILVPTLICAVGDGKDVGNGDSGGPLVAGGALVGLISAAADCGNPKRPSLYTNIGHSEIRSWIKMSTGLNCLSQSENNTLNNH